ncbi:MAG TPA: hypothetical protein VKR31_10395 [Rhizomicrobium sp.]|nr:hypothetical protein [Rhizomicrobium sp.]
MSPGDVVRQKSTLQPIMAIVRRYEGISNFVCWTCAWTNDKGEICHRTFVESALEPYVPAKKREREPA